MSRLPPNRCAAHPEPLPYVRVDALAPTLVLALEVYGGARGNAMRGFGGV